MAASGYTPISLYYSTTASAVPTAGNLANGELALNIADMKLYAKNSSGTVTLLASNASTTGVDSLSFGSTGLTPSTATTGAITVAGTLATTNGGTGLTSFTANGVLYASSTSALTSGSALTFDGTNFKTTGSVLAGGNAPSSGAGVTLTYNGTTGNIYSYDWGTSTYKAIGLNGNSVDISAAGNTQTTFGVNGSEQMRLTSTGLGIGTSSPSNKLQVSASFSGTSDLQTISRFDRVSSGTAANGLGGRLEFSSQDNAGSQRTAAWLNWKLADVSSGAPKGYLSLGSRGTSEALIIDDAGNLGLGVTPSAWYTGGKALQIFNGSGGSLNAYSGEFFINQNAYLNSDASNWIRNDAGYASQYHQVNGKHIWKYGASSTAGSAITFTQAMTLDASGNLVVGATTNVNSRKLSVNGIISVQDGTSEQAFIYYTGSVTQWVSSSTPMTFYANGAERARISSAGGFSVGTTADPGAGAIYATGAITAYYSDERLKDVKGRIQNALAKVRRLSGVYYTNNETAKALGYTSDEMQVGVLAGQMKGELPEIVKPAPFDLDENGNSKSGENYMTVQYERGLPLLIEALKELADQFDDYVATH